MTSEPTLTEDEIWVSNVGDGYYDIFAIKNSKCDTEKEYQEWLQQILQALQLEKAVRDEYERIYKEYVKLEEGWMNDDSDSSRLQQMIILEKLLKIKRPCYSNKCDNDCWKYHTRCKEHLTQHKPTPPYKFGMNV